MSKYALVAFSLFYGVIQAQTTYTMNFNDYPLGSHEAQPSLNLRWSKSLNNTTNSMSISTVAGSLQGRAFTSLGSLQSFRTYRWNYENYNSGVPSKPIPPSANAEIKTRFKIDAGTYNVFSVVFHNSPVSGSNNYISADVVSYGASKLLRFTVVQNGTPVYRNGQAITISNNSWYYFKARREGTSVKVKFWASAATEPANFMESWTEPAFSGVEKIPELGVYSDVAMTVDCWEYTDLTIRQSLKMTSNHNGLSYKSSETVNVSWDQTGLDTVGVYYSLDGGKAYRYSGHSLSSQSGSRTYSWTVPDKITSDNAFIKIASRALKDSSGAFSIRPSRRLNMLFSQITKDGSVVPKAKLKFFSAGVTSVNLFYSADSVNWTLIKDNIPAAGDTTYYDWVTGGNLYGNIFIKVSEYGDTAGVREVKASSDMISLGLRSPLEGGYQNAVWYSKPVLVSGRLFTLSVKTFHWGFYGKSVISLYSYDKTLRLWQLKQQSSWDMDPYFDNAFYADSSSSSLFYFGGAYLTNPGRYFYIQISTDGNSFSFRNYDRAIDTAPLKATDPLAYSISEQKAVLSAVYLGRSYTLSGSKVYADGELFADLAGSGIESIKTPYIYGYDNRIMISELSDAYSANYSLKALVEKHEGELLSDVMKMGSRLISRRNYFRGIYPKAVR